MLYQHSKPVISDTRLPRTINRRMIGKPRYTLSTQVYNQTGQDIVMCNRLGLKTLMKPQNSGFILGEPSIVVVTQIEISGKESVSSAERMLATCGPNSNLYLVQKNKKVSGWQNDMLTLQFDAVITLRSLRDLGDSAYYNDIDMLFSLESWEEAPFHPYCSEAGPNKLIPTDSLGGLVFEAYAVDNTSQISTLYFNCNGDIHIIKPIRNHKLRNGCYCTVPIDGVKTTFRIEYNDIEGLKQRGFFLNETDALTYGNIEQAEKKQLLELQKTLTDLNNENQLKRQEYELVKLELDRLKMKEEHRIAQEKHQIDLEGTVVKHHYSNASLDRKDTSEFVKFLPNLVVGLGTVLGFLLLI